MHKYIQIMDNDVFNLLQFVKKIKQRCEPLHPKSPIFTLQVDGDDKKMFGEFSDRLRLKNCAWGDMDSIDFAQAFEDMQEHYGTVETDKVLKERLYYYYMRTISVPSETGEYPLPQPLPVVGSYPGKVIHWYFKIEEFIRKTPKHIERLEKWESRCQEITNTAILILGLLVTVVAAAIGPLLADFVKYLLGFLVHLFGELARCFS